MVVTYTSQVTHWDSLLWPLPTNKWLESIAMSLHWAYLCRQANHWNQWLWVYSNASWAYKCQRANHRNPLFRANFAMQSLQSLLFSRCGGYIEPTFVNEQLIGLHCPEPTRAYPWAYLCQRADHWHLFCLATQSFLCNLGYTIFAEPTLSLPLPTSKSLESIPLSLLKPTLGLRLPTQTVEFVRCCMEWNTKLII